LLSHQYNNNNHHYGRSGLPHSSHHSTGRRSHGGGGSSHNSHPSQRYTNEPMLCQFVWKTTVQTSQETDKEAPTGSNKTDADHDNDDHDDKNKMHETADTSDQAASLDPTDNQVVAGGGTGSSTDAAPKQPPPPTAEQQKQHAENTRYAVYRRKYCLNYVRSFFNKHLDDSWFRDRYSPLCQETAKELERQRALQEATTFTEAVHEAVLDKSSPGDATTTDNKADAVFLQQIRLGGGVKQPTVAPRKRKMSTDGAGAEAEDPKQMPLVVEPMGKNRYTAVPLAHTITCAKNALYIHDIPAHVTDQQLVLALMDHCTIPVTERQQGSTLKVFASTPSKSNTSGSGSSNNNNNSEDYKRASFLQRHAFVVCPDAVMRQDILRNLKKLAGNSASQHHVPRKEEDEIAANQRLPLDVECSDPYGRLEYDADGKGGAPADGLAVPPRKAVVLVSAPRPPAKLQIVKVLSAALSSKERIPHDKEAACLLARALDVAKQIPRESRLDELLEQLFPDHPSDAAVVEDMLDVSIAYLRRVHLFSFYNGCTWADSVADVLAGKHAVSSIHVRLQNADDILEETKDDAGDGGTQENPAAAAPKSKDLLVQRLDDSIAKALENCNIWVDGAEQIHPDVACIEEAETVAEHLWVENHSSLDDDGRARCRFHFCHKLFKDSSFLRKHLLKKHVEYLRAEQAKCHDEYMMKAWDAEAHRPVPDVMIECGSMFGLVPSPVQGQIPDAEDPEPGMWRKAEERRKRDSEMRPPREMRRPDFDDNRSGPSSSAPSGGGGGGFVDVDDMKEEKMQVSFDNVEIPAVAPKRKKKKRKLL